MGLFDAPSDLDYYDSLGHDHTGEVERTCTGCSRPVWVSLDEPYLVQVFCEDCQRREPKVPAKAHPSAKRDVA